MQGAKYCAEACQSGCALAQSGEDCLQDSRPSLRPSCARAWEVILLAYGETDGWSSSVIDLRFCAELLRDAGAGGGELLESVAKCKIAASEIREIAQAVRELEESKRETQSGHRRQR